MVWLSQNTAMLSVRRGTREGCMRCARCGFDTTDLWAVLPVVASLLQREGRVTYQALKRELSCDDAFLASLCEELIFAKRVARDEDGKVLVWIGEGEAEETGKRRIGESANKLERSLSFQTLDARRQTLDAPRQTLDVSRPDAERRQLTVMFCDLVGSTTL